nr:MAG TPA: hypothetical protein [Caudoviricetes sp.]
MFEFKDKQYEMKFNRERVKLVEKANKGSLIGEWVQTNGMWSLQTIELVFQLCVKEAGSDHFLSQREGLELCNDYMAEKGYGAVALMVQEALQDDMPFLFRTT